MHCHQLNPFLESVECFQRLLFSQFFIISNIKCVFSYWIFALKRYGYHLFHHVIRHLSLKATIIVCIFLGRKDNYKTKQFVKVLLINDLF
jgi:hypothetical protein